MRLKSAGSGREPLQNLKWKSSEVEVVRCCSAQDMEETIAVGWCSRRDGSFHFFCVPTVVHGKASIPSFALARYFAAPSALSGTYLLPVKRSVMAAHGRGRSTPGPVGYLKLPWWGHGPVGQVLLGGVPCTLRYSTQPHLQKLDTRRSK